MSGTGSSASPWWVRSRPVVEPRVRLICLPYAGGGPAIYRAWPDRLPGDMELCAVRLPGRESRLNEQPFTRLGPLIEALATALQPLTDRPYALFGHSMGALLAFELTRWQRRAGEPGPVHLFVAGHRAPRRPRRGQETYKLTDAQFLDYLRRRGGTPREVLASAELMELLLPSLRADFEVCETYTYSSEPPLECPITALGGDRDSDVSASAIAEWSAETSSTFTARMLPGDHFFLHSQSDAILLEIRRALQPR